MNTHNPAVQQNGDAMLVTYLAHDIMHHTRNKFWQMAYATLRKKFSWDIFFYWPGEEFLDEIRVIPYELNPVLQESLQFNSDESAFNETTNKNEDEGDEEIDEKEFHSIVERTESIIDRNAPVHTNGEAANEETVYYDLDEERLHSSGEAIAEGDVVEVEDALEQSIALGDLDIAVAIQEAEEIIVEEVEDVVEIPQQPENNNKKKSKGNKWMKGIKQVQKSINTSTKQVVKTVQRVERQASKSTQLLARDITRSANSTLSVMSEQMKPVGNVLNKALGTNSKKLMIKNYITDPAKQGWHWRVGRRNSCFVAFLSTKPLDDSRLSDQEFEVNSMKAPLQTFVSKAKQISFVVVVGTTDEYSSINDFFNKKLKHIIVTEHLRNNVYNVSVYDTSVANKTIRYACNALKPT
jgi:hypothetical protein